MATASYTTSGDMIGGQAVAFIEVPLSLARVERAGFKALIQLVGSEDLTLRHDAIDNSLFYGVSKQ